MCADGCLAGGDDLGDGCRVVAMLLVFLLEASRIFSAVPHAPFMRHGWRRRRQRIGGIIGHAGILPERMHGGEPV